ncbi:MAG: helix-turn-helix transcriptional regulator [Xanthomonadales bacterium]|nr:helix-turn-helix transcriptional regulator [Xanthomonadales bacterium]
MEQEMKLSAAVVRRLRLERGWSQEQLALASGLSLRTIQRVEADASGSLATKVCLAATFGVPLAELSEDAAGQPLAREVGARPVGALLIGLAVLACVLISESGRLPGLPMSDAMAVLNTLMAVLGAVLAIPAAFRLAAQGHVASVALATIGTPLVVLLAAGVVLIAISGRVPMWQLWAFGACGIALVAMALRRLCARTPQAR